MAQEAAGQIRNDANAPLRTAHEAKTKLPSTKHLRDVIKHSAAAVALGRAKQVQYVIDDAVAMMKSYRTKFFGWLKEPAQTRGGKPRPPGFFSRGHRAKVRFDYQDFRVEDGLAHLPESFGMDPVPLVERDGSPLLKEGDRLVEIRVEPCRSRKWVNVDLVIRRAAKVPDTTAGGALYADLGVSRLITCLDDTNLRTFFVCGSVAKSILHRGHKLHAKARGEADKGARHGKARAGALAARSARQMEDLMKKVARLVVIYMAAHGLKRLVIGRNKEWKQDVDMGSRQNQLFTFIPHGKLITALKTKCARAGVEFIETEESYTSKTDHLAREEMAEKATGYRWLGSRSPRGCFRSSMGIVLQSDVNGCIGIARKVGGKEWLDGFIERLGAAPGTRLVPRRVRVNGAPGRIPVTGTRHPRLRSPRAWMNTKVALQTAGLLPADQCALLEHGGQVAGGVASYPHAFPAAA